VQGKPKFSEKTCPSATFVHQKIPHDQTRVWTRASAVGSRRLTAWAMARRKIFPLFLIPEMPAGFTSCIVQVIPILLGSCNHCSLACFLWSTIFEHPSSALSMAEMLIFCLMVSQGLLISPSSSRLCVSYAHITRPRVLTRFTTCFGQTNAVHVPTNATARKLKKATRDTATRRLKWKRKVCQFRWLWNMLGIGFWRTAFKHLSWNLDEWERIPRRHSVPGQAGTVLIYSLTMVTMLFESCEMSKMR
jgi:hypothetical protein